MSKPRYNWWPFVLNMIKDYPARKKEYNDLHEQKVTANLSGMPGGGGASRTVEDIAVRKLPHQEQLEFDAVRKAVECTRSMEDGEQRIKVVGLTLWRQSHTVPGAALALNIPERTARRYRWRFVMLVGYTYGFLTEEEYIRETKKDAGKR